MRRDVPAMSSTVGTTWWDVEILKNSKFHGPLYTQSQAQSRRYWNLGLKLNSLTYSTDMLQMDFGLDLPVFTIVRTRKWETQYLTGFSITPY